MFHLEWDKLNIITENLHGSNVVNSTGGIMIQDVKHGFDTNQDQTLPIYMGNNARSLKVDTPETLAHVYIYSRVGITFPERALFTPPAINSEAYSKCMQ